MRVRVYVSLDLHLAVSSTLDTRRAGRELGAGASWDQRAVVNPHASTAAAARGLASRAGAVGDSVGEHEGAEPRVKPRDRSSDETEGGRSGPGGEICKAVSGTELYRDTTTETTISTRNWKYAISRCYLGFGVRATE